MKLRWSDVCCRRCCGGWHNRSLENGFFFSQEAANKKNLTKKSRHPIISCLGKDKTKVIQKNYKYKKCKTIYQLSEEHEVNTNKELIKCIRSKRKDHNQECEMNVVITLNKSMPTGTTTATDDELESIDDRGWHHKFSSSIFIQL